MSKQQQPTQVGPFQFPSLYSVVGSLTLSAVIPSTKQYQRIVETFAKIPELQDPTQLQHSIQGLLNVFQTTAELLPPELLEHRIKNWLLVGSSVLVESRLQQLQTPTFIVCGGADKLLPSKQEAKRLTALLPKSQQLTIAGAGHLVLDDTVNLTEAILYSEILDPLHYIEEQQQEEEQRKKKYDPIIDWTIPTWEVMNATLTT